MASGVSGSERSTPTALLSASSQERCMPTRTMTSSSWRLLTNGRTLRDFLPVAGDAAEVSRKDREDEHREPPNIER